VRPIDVPTRETIEFIRKHVAPGASLLEVGCGPGDVAASLVALGYRVTALDTDADLVGRARSLGVEAHVARWPEYDAPAVDAVAFTRSLHHIDPLDAALQRAAEALRPGGRLLVEDFAFAAADDATIDWFVGLVRGPDAARVLQSSPGEFVTRLRKSPDPRAEWRHDGGHDIHSIDAMTVATQRHFAVHRVDGAPYLYRYLVPVLPPDRAGAEFLESVLRSETAAIRERRVVAVGRRIVAQNQPEKNSLITVAS
jgi:SAM-dependent methyltransferase